MRTPITHYPDSLCSRDGFICGSLDANPDYAHVILSRLRILAHSSQESLARDCDFLAHWRALDAHSNHADVINLFFGASPFLKNPIDLFFLGLHIELL